MQSRPATGLGLDASVTRLQNVGPAHGKKLNRLGVETVGDLLYHFPHRYDDYSKLKTISQLMYGEEVTLLVTVCEAKTRAIRNKMKITTVLLADMTGTIQATYFNQPWLQQQFKSGRRIIVSGRVEQDLGHLAFKQPEWEPLSKELIHTGASSPCIRSPKDYESMVAPAHQRCRRILGRPSARAIAGRNSRARKIARARNGFARSPFSIVVREDGIGAAPPCAGRIFVDSTWRVTPASLMARKTRSRVARRFARRPRNFLAPCPFN